MASKLRMRVLGIVVVLGLLIGAAVVLPGNTVLALRDLQPNAATPANVAHSSSTVYFDPASTPTTLGWVGNMYPAGGSTTTLTTPASFDVYVFVYKTGVTESSGQGPNISCTVQWATVGYFGGPWYNTTNAPMTYISDEGNNDRYKGTITPPVGLYEFTAFCTDLTDSTSLYQTSGNGKLLVDTASGSCNSAQQGDNNVYYNGLFHDSFSTSYRNPVGPVTTSQGTVMLKFRTCMDDLDSAPAIRVWNDRLDSESITALTFDSHSADASLGGVTTWKIDLAIPSQPTILYYVFRATNGTATAYYRDDDPKFYGGGFGVAENSQTEAYKNSYQLTVYDPAFSVPSWMQRGTVYQIFPDRFRDGDSTNNPTAGRFSYNMPGGAIVRSNQSDWNYTVCDPRSTYSPSCANKYGDNFYGGDLRGIIQKLEDGYFDNLGVSVLYLNPIFRSPSNHKYDTADYMVIDPDFGTLADFQELTTKAEARGIKVILDGVFNHTSSDSKYFDYYRRYDSAGNLTSPSGIGADDNSGACESPNSTYRSWFYIGGNPPNQPSEKCDPNDGDDPGGAWTDPYEAWYGYGSLPKLQANSAPVRNLIWNNGLSSVGPYWVNEGADGWRFDVGGDVDPGLTNDPANDYWEGFRTAVRTINAQTLTLGEEWGDATPWLLGAEWDSVMNYRFRSALLSWLFTGCSGNGCSGGTVFEDNDSNSGSSSGAISAISPSQFNARLRSIAEDYPPIALKAMMNLEGSHDTNRVRFLLKKINNDNDAAAVQRMKEWWIFAFTYPGAPTLYYGDEIGLNHDGVWASSKWEDDPYNRAPFPWPDASGGSYSYDTNAQSADLAGFARHMASIRWSYRALQDGDVQHGLIINDGQKLYGYARTYGVSPNTQTALIALNRDSAAHTATFSGLNAAPFNLPDGTVLVNALDPSLTTYTVSGGSVSVSVSPTWGVVLLEQATIDTPAQVTGLTSTVVDPIATLTWNTVSKDTNNERELPTAYEVHRDPTNPSFTPGPATLRGTVKPSDPTFRFGYTDGKFTFSDSIVLAATAGVRPQAPAATYYYKVCAINAPGMHGACASVGPLAVSLASFTAAVTPHGVTLAWETVSEQDNVGFNVYRTDSSLAARGDGGLAADPLRMTTSEAGAEWVKLNPALIPAAAPGSAEGHAYTWTDATAQPGLTYWYLLEDVALDGTATQHPPVQVTVGEPNAVGLAGFGATALPQIPRIERILPLAALGLVALAGAGMRRRRRI